MRSATPIPVIDGELLDVALAATRAAALAAATWAGHGDPMAADGAATDAMRRVLADSPSIGTVVTGEGAKDAAPGLVDGERLGIDGACAYDIAVDPLECTDLCARGLAGALSTIAVAPAGALWSPGPAYYMEKLVLGPASAYAAMLGDSVESIVGGVAEALGRAVGELRAIVLDKPRHARLIAELRELGVSVSTPTAGDVAGALAVLLPDGDADLLLGIGGTPEGVLAACAAAELGGSLQGRVAPQRDDERAACAAAGIDVRRLLTLEELVAGPAAFVATGVTGGLLAAPRHEAGAVVTESIVIAGGSVRRIHQRSPTEE